MGGFKLDIHRDFFFPLLLQCLLPFKSDNQIRTTASVAVADGSFHFRPPCPLHWSSSSLQSGSVISSEPGWSLSLNVVRWRGETAMRMPERERERERCVVDGERQMIGGERKNELNKLNSVWH